MEFKRYIRKGLIFNNNSFGIGLEVKLEKNLKVYRIERLANKENKTFSYSIFDGPKIIDGDIKNEMIVFLEQKNSEYNFFEGEVKMWKKIH